MGSDFFEYFLSSHIRMGANVFQNGIPSFWMLLTKILIQTFSYNNQVYSGYTRLHYYLLILNLLVEKKNSVFKWDSMEIVLNPEILFNTQKPKYSKKSVSLLVKIGVLEMPEIQNWKWSNWSLIWISGE